MGDVGRTGNGCWLAAWGEGVDVATVGGVWIMLGANTAGLINGLGKAQQAVSGFAGKVGTGLGKVGGAVNSTMGAVGSAAGSAATAVSGTLGSLFSGLPGVAGSAMQGFGAFSGGIQALFSGFGRLFESIPFVGSAISGLIGSVGILGGGFLMAGGAVAAFGVHQAALKENALVTLKVLTGSAKAGEQLFNSVEKLSIGFRLSTQEMVQSAGALLNVGVSAKDVTSLLAQLSPLAAMGGGGLMENMDALIRAVTQIKAAGTLRGQEALQLFNINIPIYELVARKLGKTVGEVRKLGEAGEISAATAINALLERGNQLIPLMQEKAQTLSGLWGGVMNTFKLFARDIGEGLVKHLNLKGSLRGFDDWLASLRETWVPNVVRVIGNVITAVAPVWKAGIGVLKTAFEVMPAIITEIGTQIGNLLGFKGDGKSPGWVDSIVNGLILIDYLLKNWRTVSEVVVAYLKLNFLTFGFWLKNELSSLIGDAVGAAIDAALKAAGKKVSENKALAIAAPGLSVLGSLLTGGGSGPVGDSAQELARKMEVDKLQGIIDTDKAKLQGGWDAFLKKRKAELATPFGSKGAKKDPFLDSLLGKPARVGETQGSVPGVPGLPGSAVPASPAVNPLQFSDAIVANSDKALAMQAQHEAQSFDYMQQRDKEAAARHDATNALIKELLAAFRDMQIPAFTV